MDEKENLQRIYDQYSGKKIKFFVIYITEAHPQGLSNINDLFQDPCPSSRGPRWFPNPKSNEERIFRARQFINDTNFELPLLVDDISNGFNRNYGAEPQRLYIFYHGKLWYRGKPGPFGYNLKEWESTIKTLL